MTNTVRMIIPVLSPFPISLILLLTGLCLLILKRKKSALACIVSATCMLLVFGYGVCTKQALYRLERLYPPLSVERLAPNLRHRIRYVVVLGSGHISDPGLPNTAQIGIASLYRLTEGIRIYRQLPGSRLIISGGTIPDSVKNARIVGDVAYQLGIPAQDVTLEERPADTFEEARTLHHLLGNEPFVLVTSAAHMKRAMDIFQRYRMQPVPAPTDFILKNRSGGTGRSWLPNLDNLLISQKIIYEWLGEIWVWMKRISPGSKKT